MAADWCQLTKSIVATVGLVPKEKHELLQNEPITHDTP